jgi:hypothetical protein
MNRRPVALAAICLTVAALSAATPALPARPALASGRSGAVPRTALIQPDRVNRTPLPPPSMIAGYVWSGDPAGSYYGYNSAGGSITVTTASPGLDIVAFGNLGSVLGGTVDVTPYRAPGTCGPGVWSPHGNTWSGSAFCFSLGGIPQPSLFDMAITEPTSRPRGVLDFDYVPATGSLRLKSPFQYNSAHKTNSVRHLGTGRYQITMPGPATRGVTGTVKVSPAGGAAGDCEIAGWHGTSGGQVVDVDCFSVTGARQNKFFTITYVRHDNLLGRGSLAGAYAYADRRTAGRYQPRTQYDSHRGARVTVTRVGLARYKVQFDGVGGPAAVNGGDVQVSTVGTSDHHCSVFQWVQGTNPYAYVDCVDNSGAPAESRFTIQWVVG